MRNELVPRITFIEIILAVMLFAILIAVIVSLLPAKKQGVVVRKKIIQHIQPETPQSIKMKRDILVITNALKFYKFDNGFYPSTQQGLQALMIKPTQQPIPTKWIQYLKSIPLDPLGKPYQYRNNGENINVFIIQSKVKPQDK